MYISCYAYKDILHPILFVLLISHYLMIEYEIKQKQTKTLRYKTKHLFLCIP